MGNTLLLDDVYDLPIFSAFYAIVGPTLPISRQWRDALARIRGRARRSRALEIGPGSGLLTHAAHKAGFDLSVVEKNVALAERLQSGNPGMHVFCGSFPGTVTGAPHDVLLMHRNTFLEVVNRHGALATARSAMDAVAPGGHVILDLLFLGDIGPVRQWTTIHAGEVATLGLVRYEYRVLERVGSGVCAEIRLKIDGKSAWEAGRTVVFDVPRVENVVDCMRVCGFALVSKTRTDEPSFFPGEQHLLIFRRGTQNGRG